MKRLLTFALLALAIACADATAPSIRTACYAYIELTLRDGRTLQWWDRFDPCPSDSALKANGWTRDLNPMWIGR
jgi:hypothetical protein